MYVFLERLQILIGDTQKSTWIAVYIEQKMLLLLVLLLNTCQCLWYTCLTLSNVADMWESKLISTIQVLVLSSELVSKSSCFNITGARLPFGLRGSLPILPSLCQQSRRRRILLATSVIHRIKNKNRQTARIATEHHTSNSLP